MFHLDLKSKKSIYEQIVDGIKGLIMSGEYQSNDKLPSVRDLSAQLTVNPNTIAKAFRALESQGWIYTVSGRGCFVSESAKAIDESQLAGLYQDLEAGVRELLFMGIGEEEIVQKIRKMIKKGGASK